MTEEIGNLSIISDIDFVPAPSSTPVLTVDSLEISGPIECGEVIVAMDSDATIEVNQDPRPAIMRSAIWPAR